jgi:hypothetical protein
MCSPLSKLNYTSYIYLSVIFKANSLLYDVEWCSSFVIFFTELITKGATKKPFFAWALAATSLKKKKKLGLSSYCNNFQVIKLTRMNYFY